MSLSQFRAYSFEVRPSKKIEDRGKIVLYNDYLLCCEPHRGIHVFNNSDPANPVPLYFIFILGNMDAVVQNGFLYADCLTDLLVIDIRNIEQISLLKRINNALVYNPYAMLPKNAYIRHSVTSKEQTEDSIIVGWE